MIHRVITEEANGISVDIESTSKRFTVRISLAGNSVSLNLSRMEMVNLIGVLKEGYDEAVKEPKVVDTNTGVDKYDRYNPWRRKYGVR